VADGCGCPLHLFGVAALSAKKLKWRGLSYPAWRRNGWLTLGLSAEIIVGQRNQAVEKTRHVSNLSIEQ